jgi:hypothetical protein
MDPVFHHMERVPAGRAPLLFVGNHTLMGLLDVPFFFFALLHEHDIFLRSMGDRMHFRVPGWADFFTRWGVIEGNRDRCGELLAEGEPVLVFPGGAREVAKRRNEQYRLMWGTRLGFAKLAIRHQATIVPFAMVGADDAWDIVMDADEICESLMGPVIEATWSLADIPRGSMPPLIKGLAGTPVPKPVRLYFGVGEPVETGAYAGLEDDDSAAFALREEVASAIESEIAFLLNERKWDVDDGSLRRRVTTGMLKLLKR